MHAWDRINICANAALTIFGDLLTYIQPQIWIDLDHRSIMNGTCSSLPVVVVVIFIYHKSLFSGHTRTRSREIGHHMDVACNYCNTLLFVEYCSDPNSKYSTFIYFISSSKLNLLNNFDRIYRKMYQHIQYSKSVALNSPWTYLDGIFVIYLNLYTLIYFLKFRLKITKFVLDQAKIKCNLFITRTGYLQMEKRYIRGDLFWSTNDMC